MSLVSLVQTHKFHEAIELLQKEPIDKNAYHSLSLLMRYVDDYKKESILVKNALEKFPDFEYMHERAAWHERPVFHPDPEKSKVVPRWPLDLSRDPDKIPPQEILDQLCIVTAGSGNEPYRSLLFELLESIQATTYRDVPVFILETKTMGDADKEFILKHFKNVQTIQDPGWDVDPDLVNSTQTYGRIDEVMKILTARPHIPKKFPGYRYYLWLDCDVWVQDQSSLDEVIMAAIEQGIGACPDVFYSFGEAYGGRKKNDGKFVLLDHYKKEEILNKPAINAGVFCIDVKKQFFDLWAKLYQEHLEADRDDFLTDQMALNLSIVLSEKPIELMRHQKTQYLFCPYQPCLSFDGKILYSFQSGPVGVLHLTWPKFYNRFYRPFLKHEYSNNLERAHQISRAVEGWGEDKYVDGDDIVYTSVSYRTYPWQDKEEILSMLHNFLG